MAEAAGRHELKSGRQAHQAVPTNLADYPVREYVAAMAVELARMARWDGDESLASALEAAADQARRETPTTRSGGGQAAGQ